MTIADMSVIQAEVEVDETNIPRVQLGQQAKITIDALPDKTFKGHVTEIGNSPIQTAAQNASVVIASAARNRPKASLLCTKATCRSSRLAIRSPPLTTPPPPMRCSTAS